MMQQNFSSVQSPSSNSSMPESAMTYDEASMQRSGDFLMALQELKNLRPQLYSAAEYCESSYVYSDQKQAVLENLKDYSVKSLVNAVDHLGTVAYKLNDILGQQTSELAATEIRVSSLSQRIRTCQEYTDFDGLKQQTVAKEFPRHHKHYTFPGPGNPYHEESLNAAKSEGGNSGEVGLKGNSHTLLGVNKSDNSNGYYPNTGTEAEIVSDAESNKVSARQQKLKAETGQDEEAGTLSWFFAAEAQIDSHPKSSQKTQQRKSNGYHPSSTATTGSKDAGKGFASSIGVPLSASSAKSKFGPTKPVIQHSKSFIDEKRPLSSMMSSQDAKLLELQQPHSRSKSMLFSLLGKKRGGKQSKKVLNSNGDVL